MCAARNRALEAICKPVTVPFSKKAAFRSSGDEKKGKGRPTVLFSFRFSLLSSVKAIPFSHDLYLPLFFRESLESRRTAVTFNKNKLTSS
jgi:hypothetical protein